MAGGGKGGAAKTKLPGYISDASKAAMSQADYIAKRPYQEYGGQTVADLTPDQLAAFGYVRGQLGTTQGQLDALRANYADLPNYAQQYMNPWLGAVEQNAISNLQRQGALEGNQLAAQAHNINAFGGDRYAIQQGVLGGEVARQAGDLSAQLRMQGYDTGMQQAAASLQAQSALAQQGQQAGLTSAQALLGTGQQQQAQQQAQLEDAYNRWLERWNYPLQQLQVRLAALQGTPYLTQTKPAGGNVLGGVAGGAMTGAGTGAMFGPWGALIGGVAGGALGGISAASQ